MADSEKDKYHGEAVPAQTEDTTRVNDEVLSTIAGIELSKIDGINPAGGGITDFLGRKSPSKGITIEASGDEITVEVIVIVDYGIRIPDVTQKIQTNIRNAITEMTGKFVSAVNVTVQGIRTNIEKREHITENMPQNGKEEE